MQMESMKLESMTIEEFLQILDDAGVLVTDNMDWIQSFLHNRGLALFDVLEIYKGTPEEE